MKCINAVYSGTSIWGVVRPATPISENLSFWQKAGPAGEPEVSDKAEASGIVSSPAAALGSDMEFSEASAESSSLQEVVDSLLLSPTASLGQHDDSGASLESGSLTGGGASEQAQIGNELAALELSDPADEKQPSQDQAVQRGLEGDN